MEEFRKGRRRWTDHKERGGNDLEVKREMGIGKKKGTKWQEIGPDLISRELTWEICITQEAMNLRTFF